MYVYRGAELDAHLPKTIRPSCGTRSGYIIHRRHDEDACQPCLDANAAYRRAWHHGRKVAA